MKVTFTLNRRSDRFHPIEADCCRARRFIIQQQRGRENPTPLTVMNLWQIWRISLHFDQSGQFEYLDVVDDRLQI